MKFGTWCSKWQAVRRNLLRFWPACLIFAIVLILHVLTIEPPKTLNDVYSIYFSILVASIYGSLYGGICAILLFRDLFTQRYAVAVHALPQTREAIFLGNFLSGLLMVLIPLLPAVLLGIAGSGFSFAMPLQLAAVTLLLWFYGFAIGALSATFSGTTFGAIAVSFFLVCGLPLGETIGGIVIGELMPGIGPMERAPLTAILSPLQRLAVCSHTDKLPWGNLLLWGGIDVLLLSCALWLYKKRKLEVAGDFVAFPGLKPVLKALFTFYMGIIIGTVVSTILAEPPMMGAYSLGHTLGWLLPGNLLGVLAAEMLVEKTVRVFKGRQLLRYGLCALLTFGVCALIWADPAGISTKVPGQEEISCVYISDGTYGFTAESPEAIAAVLQLHEEVTTDLSSCDKGHFGYKLELRYTLKNGRSILRFYSVMDGFAHDAISGYFNHPRWGLSCYLGQELPEAALTGGEYTLKPPVTASVRLGYSTFELNFNPENLKELLYHLGRDIEAGKVTLFPWSGGDSHKYCICFKDDVDDTFGGPWSFLYLTDVNSETYDFVIGLLKR